MIFRVKKEILFILLKNNKYVVNGKLIFTFYEYIVEQTELINICLTDSLRKSISSAFRSMKTSWKSAELKSKKRRIFLENILQELLDFKIMINVPMEIENSSNITRNDLSKTFSYLKI